MFVHDVSYQEAIKATSNFQSPYHISAGDINRFYLVIFLFLTVGLLIFAFAFYPSMIKFFILFGIVCFSIQQAIKIFLFIWDYIRPFKAYSPKAIVPETECPVYSVVLALYKEKEVIPALFSSLLKLQYPRERIDLVFVLEQDDQESLQTIKSYSGLLENIPFRIFIAPDHQPKTKPKALNIALPYLKGEYVVVYDAEDRPDPYQLIKSLSSFKELPEDVGALQARLTFYNATRCWLTKLFTIEYDIWFHHYLPGLFRLGFPIPFAGTSTHFKTNILKDIGGWDAHNVTEDCDLGMRYAKLKKKTVMLDSDTREEAPINILTWGKQRTRWMKGYLQTFIAHCAFKKPFFSLKGLFGFWFVVGGQYFSTFFHLIILGASIYSFFFENIIQNLFSNHLLYFGIVILLWVGFFLIPLSALMVYHRLRRHESFIKWSFLHPLYWAMASVSSYRAIWQLIFCPYYWEKTPHGLDLFE